MGNERCGSRPFALNTCTTARRLNGSATSVYSASVGMATTRPRRSAAAARLRAAMSGSTGSISTRSVAMISARPDGIGHVERHLVAAEGSAELNALHHRAHALDHLARNRHTLLARLLGIVYAPHAFHELVRNRHAQLVHHELGVA